MGGQCRALLQLLDDLFHRAVQHAKALEGGVEVIILCVLEYADALLALHIGLDIAASGVVRGRQQRLHPRDARRGAVVACPSVAVARHQLHTRCGGTVRVGRHDQAVAAFGDQLHPRCRLP